MGNGGSKGGGGGGSGSKGNSICGIDRRDIRSITHEYTSDKSKTGTICITSSISKGGVTDCFSTHYRESYPSAHSNSRGGEGRSGSSGSSSTHQESRSDSYDKQELSKTVPKYERIGLTPQLKSLESIYGTGYDSIGYDYYGGQGRSVDMRYGTISDSIVLVRNTLKNNSSIFGYIDKVRFISLKNCGLLDADLLYFTEQIIKNYPLNLLELDLSKNSNISSLGVSYLLRTPKYTVSLDLSGNNIDQYGLIYIAAGLTQSKLPSLTSLNLSGNCIADGGIAYLLENAVVPSLKAIDLSGNKITSLGLAYCYRLNSFGTAKYIVNLNLCNNNIDDWGAKYLAEGLIYNKFPYLKTLRLEGNKITDEGHGFLIDSLKVISQHIVVKLKKYSADLGQKVIKPALKEFIKYAQEQGIDTSHIVTDKPTIEYLKDVGIIGKNILFGVAKCNYTLLEILTLDTTLPSVVTDIAIEKSGSKVLKKGNLQVCIGLEVYDAFVSTEGADLAIKAVELIGEE